MRIARGRLIVLMVVVGTILGGCSTKEWMRSDEGGPEHSSTGQTASEIVESQVSDGLVAGAVLLVTRRGKVVERGAFGYAQKYEYGGRLLTNPHVMTPEHVFDLASLTKVFATTFAIMMLVDDETVALDESVQSYLPEFTGSSRDSITVRHLLSHTSGLPPWQPTYFHARSSDDAFNYIRDLQLDYPVGASRHYSDLGFMLLGYIVERVSGLGLDAFLAQGLYRRLGLQNTGFRPLKTGLTPLVATSQGNPFERRMIEDPDFGYLIREQPSQFSDWRAYTLLGEVNDGNSWYAHDGVAGHAGLFSTVADLKVLVTLLMDGGLYNGVQLIKSETISEFLTPDYTENGLGWAMSSNVLPVSNMPEGAFGHTGFTGTYVYANPAKHLSVILLTNRQNAGVNEDGNYPSLSALRRSVVASAERSTEAAE